MEKKAELGKVWAYIGVVMEFSVGICMLVVKEFSMSLHRV